MLICIIFQILHRLRHVVLSAKSDAGSPRPMVNRQEDIRVGTFVLGSSWINPLVIGNFKILPPMAIGSFNANVDIREFAGSPESKYEP